MRFLSFGHPEGRRPGVCLDEERVLDIAAQWPHWPRGWRGLLAAGLRGEIERQIKQGAFQEANLRPLAGLRLCAPVPDPSKIVALGRNYASHAAEQKRAVSARPLLFAKAPSCLVGQGDTVIVPPHESKPDAEAELALIIGRRAKDVAADEAFDYIAGITAFNDVSGREAQFGDKLWLRGKSFDTFGPAGPWAVSLDECGDPDRLDLSLSINGEYWQRTNTAEMMVSCREILAYVSAQMTLFPGDLIATGTPGGVGVFQDPPRFLQDGDLMAVSLETVGTLENRVERHIPAPTEGAAS